MQIVVLRDADGSGESVKIEVSARTQAHQGRGGKVRGCCVWTTFHPPWLHLYP